VEITASTYLIVLPMVFLAALVDSISGGGGLISLPAYSMAGLNYDLAAGSNKFSATFGTLTATIKYARSGKVMWMPALYSIIGVLPGSWLGTRVSMWLGNEIMNVFMIIAIPVIGLFVAFNKKEPKGYRSRGKWQAALFILLGLAIGFYDGFFGPGTGTFFILVFTHVAGMDMVSASATTKPVNLASNIAAVVTRIAAGSVVYQLAIPAVALSITGGWLGSKLALMKGARFVRYVMLAVLALLTVKLALDMVA